MKLAPANQRDIAKALGVTQAAVSMALSGKPGVSDELRARIREMSERLGYCPNYAALSLSGRGTRTISIVTTSMVGMGEGLSRYLGFLQHEVNEAGYKFRLDQMHSMEQVVAERSADGLIVLDSLDGYETSVRRAGNMPCVYGGGPSLRAPVNAVPMDNFNGARDAVRHLISLGHKRITFLGLIELWPLCRERHLGYMAAMESAGLNDYTRDKGSVIRFPDWVSDTDDVGAYADRIIACTESGTTAFLCSNDIAAIGAIKVLQGRGLGVPGDVSVVGFDDTTIARSWVPSLTTVRVDNGRAARTAVGMVLDLIRSGTPSPAAVIPTELIIRKTTAEPRRMEWECMQ